MPEDGKMLWKTFMACVMLIELVWRRSDHREDHRAANYEKTASREREGKIHGYVCFFHGLFPSEYDVKQRWERDAD